MGGTNFLVTGGSDGERIRSRPQSGKKAHENLYYNGLCTIVEYGSVTDPETKRTTQKEITVIENQPCNLSFEKLVPLFKQTRQRQFRKA